VTELLASIDNQKLLFGGSTCEDDLRSRNPVHDASTFLDFIIVKGFLFSIDFSKLITMDNNGATLKQSFLGIHFTDVNEVVVFQFWFLDDIHLVGNSGSSWGLITSDHDDFNSGALALFDRNVDLRAWWVVQ
jgi:hypothetical protein